MTDAADRTTLEARAAALLELSSRQRAFPLYYYEPASEKIAAFHRSPATVRILAGGNRSGKTESNTAEILAAALGYRPWILRERGIPAPKDVSERPPDLPEEAIVFNASGIRIQIPASILVVTGLPARTGIGEVLEPKLRKLGGPHIEQTWSAHGGILGKARLKNGSTINFCSSEQDLTAFEGSAFDSIHIDEPIPRRIYTALSRGSVDRSARRTATFTPLGASAAWFLRDLYPVTDRKRVEVFQTSIFDNKFLTPEAIKEFAEDPTLSEQERQARLYGRFASLSDSIFSPPFDPTVHVIDDFRLPTDGSWSYITVIDPATVRPWAIALFAISPNGTCYIVKERPATDITKMRRSSNTIEDYARIIRDMEADLPMAGRLIDPNYGPAQHTVRGVLLPSLLTELHRWGLFFDHNIPDSLEYGEARLRSMLAYRTAEPLSAMNQPRLFVFRSCVNSINSMLYHSAKDRVRSDGMVDDTKRDPHFSDFADVARYFAVKFSDLPVGVPEAYVTDTAPTYYGSEEV